MEIQLKRRNSYDWYQGAGTTLCTGQLRREIAFPEGELTIYAVFTKKKVADSFRIDAPTNTAWGKASTITGLKGGVELLTSTRLVLAKAYKKGYRYVRIEY